MHLTSIGTAWDDPRLDLRIGDGIAFVKEADTEPFDVIFLDGSDPIGPSTGLYDEAVLPRLRTGARTARHLRPAKRIAVPDARALPPDPGDVAPGVRTSRSVFRAGADFYGCGIWSWTCASRGTDPMAIADARAERIEAQSRYYNRDVHRGAFALPNDLRR